MLDTGRDAAKRARDAMLPSLLILTSFTLSTHSGPLPDEAGPAPRSGSWRAWLESPGGELPFGLELECSAGRWAAVIGNASERLRYDDVQVEQGQLRLRLDPYDSWIEAEVLEEGARLRGRWSRGRGRGERREMLFHATHGRAPRFAGLSASPAEAAQAPPSELDASGRWAVDFESSEELAVGVFARAGDALEGTFLTSLGDYRYLEGRQLGRELRLSCFDGAHAFLFSARLDAQGELQGDFWSSDRWHESWSGRRDEDAQLADDFGLTSWRDELPLAQLVFPDLTGSPRSLDDAAFQGRARILFLFGSWCPNCGDATRAMIELQERYNARGLRVLGLAFEYEDEPQRMRAVLSRYVETKGVPYPILIAGPADKAEASRRFPALDRVRAFPTTVFLDGAGRVLAVHTGFSGPATGAAHARLLERFDELVEAALAER